MTFNLKMLEEREEGRKEGELKLSSLMEKLLKDNKLKELQEAVTDIVKRQELYRAYGIS